MCPLSATVQIILHYTSLNALVAKESCFICEYLDTFEDKLTKKAALMFNFNWFSKTPSDALEIVLAC